MNVDIMAEKLFAEMESWPAYEGRSYDFLVVMLSMALMAVDVLPLDRSMAAIKDAIARYLATVKAEREEEAAGVLS